MPVAGGRNRTRPVAGGAPDGGGHFTIGADRRISEWDDAAARLLGVPRDAALGRPCDEVLGGKSDFGRAVCGTACPAWHALGEGGIAGKSRMLVRAANGTRQRLACELVALPGGGALGRLRGADHGAPDLAYDLAGIAALTTRASDEPLQQGLGHALDFLLHATIADAGEVFLAEPHGNGVVRTCHRGCFGRAFDQVQRFDPGEGFPGLVLSRGQPVYSGRLREDPRFLRTQVTREGFSTYACSPLGGRGGPLGCLALAFRRADIDLERVLNLLRWVGTPMGLVVDTALAHLRETTTLPLRGVEGDLEHRLPQALRGFLQDIVRVSRTDGGELYLPWNGAELRVTVPGASAVPPCPVLSNDTLRRCPAFDSGRPSVLHGRRTAWPLACRDATHPGGAWSCIPMSCDGESLGMIRLLHRRLRPTPPNENMAMIEGLATLAAEKLRDLRDQVVPVRHAEATPPLRRGRDTAPTDATGDAATRSMPRARTVERLGEGQLAIRCLGPLEWSVNGVPVAPAAIRRKRVTTLLGILVTGHDQPQCRDALIEMLWPGADPEVRTQQFHVVVHELRKLLEPQSRGGNWVYVRNRGDRYVFDTQSSCWIDALEFRAWIERGHIAEATRDEEAAIGAYEAATELYRGDYLQDEPFAEWCWQVREELREACLDAHGRLSALWGRQARWDRSVACARRALVLDPLREEMHRALMYALWASGRRDEAVRQYEACAHLLRERLDLTPLPETDRLFARIRATPRPDPGH